MGNVMRKLITYGESQYRALIDQLEGDDFELMSLLEFSGIDQIAELNSRKNIAVDVSSFVRLLSGDPQLASKIEMLVHQLPPLMSSLLETKTPQEEEHIS